MRFHCPHTPLGQTGHGGRRQQGQVLMLPECPAAAEQQDEQCSAAARHGERSTPTSAVRSGGLPGPELNDYPGDDIEVQP
jgi:hypothetical protein